MKKKRSLSFKRRNVKYVSQKELPRNRFAIKKSSKKMKTIQFPKV